MRLAISDVVAAVNGTLVGHATGAFVDGLANDSRRVVGGECFVALVDERDGHDFVADAFARGANAAIVQTAVHDLDAANAQIVVDDPMRAIARLAAHARRRALPDARVIGVTGSTGKTSTKDLLASVLSQGGVTHVNTASFNNEIGLPVTLLGAPGDAKFVVCEMGARFKGNIADLCAIAAPDTGVITNIGVAHAEHLGGPGGVLEVKSELLDALPGSGLAVLPADDATFDALRQRVGGRVLSAGAHERADVRVEVIDTDRELRCRIRVASPWGAFETRLGLRGAHQATNAALAAAVGLEAGIGPDQVAFGLARAVGSAWRMELARTVGGINVLNDSYNANPQSMSAAIDALGRLGDPPASRIAILGTMLELGPTSVGDHVALAPQLAHAKVDTLIAVGETDEMRALVGAATGLDIATHAVVDAQGALAAVGSLDLVPGDSILIKASRAIGLDTVAHDLLRGGEGGR